MNGPSADQQAPGLNTPPPSTSRDRCQAYAGHTLAVVLICRAGSQICRLMLAHDTVRNIGNRKGGGDGVVVWWCGVWCDGVIVCGVWWGWWCSGGGSGVCRWMIG